MRSSRLLRKTKFVFMLLLLAVLIVPFTNCSQSDFSKKQPPGGQHSGNGEGYPGMRSLQLESPSAVVEPLSTTKVTASGGTAPYRFAIHSGPGAIDPSSGDYTAPSLPGGQAVIRAVDSEGRWGEIILKIDFIVQAKPNTTLLPPGAPEDRFGFGGQTAGSYAIIGAHAEDAGATDSGSAYVYAYDGTSWVQQAKLTPPDIAAFDSFGMAASISPDGVALIGSQGDDDNGSGSGSAYIYRNTGGIWTLEQKLTAPDGEADDRFGRTVAISGSLAVVGAFRDDEACTDCGALYTFRHDGTTWVYESKLTPSGGTPAQNFATQYLSLSGNRILVGADRHSGAGANAGAAYVFVYDGTQWKQEALLQPQGLKAGDEFGYAVALSGDTAAISAWGDDSHVENSGAVYVFRLLNGQWVQQAKLTAHHPVANNAFGRSVGLYDHLLVIGSAYETTSTTSSGAMYVYVRDGDQWFEHQRLEAPASAYKFGSFVSVWETRVCIGASDSSFNGTNSGAAFTYDIGR